jgi:hypothetical protein
LKTGKSIGFLEVTVAEALKTYDELFNNRIGARDGESDEGLLAVEEFAREDHHVLLGEEKFTELNDVRDGHLVKLLYLHKNGCVECA